MAEYSCADSANSAYGSGAYGTCSEQTQSVGAPNTGVFQELTSSGAFAITLPLIASIIVVVIATVLVKRRKQHTQNK